MHSILIRRLIYCLLLLSLFSCNKGNEDEIQVIEPDPIYGDIEIEVILCNDPPICLDTQAADGALVYLYKSIEDRSQSADVLRTGVADIDGKLTFTRLSIPTVYITVVYNQTAYFEVENVPQRTKSFLRVEVFN